MTERLVTAEQLADFLAVPVSSVWKAARENEIPHYKLGRIYRFDLDAVLTFLSDSINIEVEKGAQER